MNPNLAKRIEITETILTSTWHVEGGKAAGSHEHSIVHVLTNQLVIMKTLEELREDLEDIRNIVNNPG